MHSTKFGKELTRLRYETFKAKRGNGRIGIGLKQPSATTRHGLRQYYSPNKLNNFTLRTEFFIDPQGQRNGVVTNYVDAALAWQHWFSPQIEMRPEIAYYRSLNADAFNCNVNAGIPPSKNWAVIAASDLIIHF